MRAVHLLNDSQIVLSICPSQFTQFDELSVGKELQDKIRDKELPFERSSYRIAGKIGTKEVKVFIFPVTDFGSGYRVGVEVKVSKDDFSPE